MLRDITIGQYFPGKSLLHRLDPRIKIIITIIFIVMLFVAANSLSIALTIVFLALIVSLSGIPLRLIMRSVKPIIPLIIFTSILNIFFVDGQVLFQYSFFKITYEGVELAAKMIIRILSLIMGTSLLTYTTSPIALTDAIERLLKPLNKVKFPVHEMAMMMTIALRFIPTLIDETDKIMSAQKARGADLETGSIAKRTKALIPILIPLFVSAFRRAEELALAMECRCYKGGDGRTRMRQLYLVKSDIFALMVSLVVTAGVIALNILSPLAF